MEFNIPDDYWIDPDGYDRRDLMRENKRLREYACHKFDCARIRDAAAKCDCGLAELLGG